MTSSLAGTSPEVSVIIACRDAAAVLGTQLTALTRQRIECAWEVLVCDNGSTDRSRAVAEQFLDRLPLRIVTADQAPGAGHARNVGVAASKGRCVAFADADDEVDDAWLAAVVEGLRHHEFIAGTYDAARLNSRWVARTRRVEQVDGLQHSPFGPGLPHAASANLAMTRTAFDLVGGFDTRLTALEDTDLCWRVQQAGVPLVFWPDAVVHVRLRSTWRAMFRQGRAYGVGARELAARYPAPDSRSGSDGPVADSSTRPRRGLLPVRAVATLVRARTPGAMLWQVGWHLGWHGRRAAR